MKYGRVDVSGPEQCPEEGKLPGRLPNLRVLWAFGFYLLCIDLVNWLTFQALVLLLRMHTPGDGVSKIHLFSEWFMFLMSPSLEDSVGHVTYVLIYFRNVVHYC